MKFLLDAEKFALAVVASSSPELTPQEKLHLYEKAYELAVNSRKFQADRYR